MKKKELPKIIKTRRTVLKKTSVKSAPLMFSYIERDRNKLRKFLPWVDKIKSIKDEVNYIKDSQKKWKTRFLFDFGLFRKKDNAYMGNLGVHTIKWDEDCCELGYWILSSFEGQGYMSEAVCSLEKEIFKLGFNRVEIRCSPNNNRSKNIPKRLGYRYEGTLRKNRKENKGYVNSMVFGKLKSEWKLRR
jgi:ribosomal-protein-serine acetyltransferase